MRIRKVSPFHKDIHQALINDQKSVSELVEDPEIGTDECDLSGKLYDCEKAIYGAIFLEAARILGNTVKESLMPAVEEFGPAVSHEGIVIDAGMPFGKKRTGHAFKITGEFIVDASGGAYATQTKEEPPPGLREDEEDIEIDIVDDEDADPVGPIAPCDPPCTVAIVPGAFKPPHFGHLDMVRRYLEGDGVKKADKVIVLISNPVNRQRTYGKDDKPITAAHSEELWRLFLGDNPDVIIKPSPKASPIQAAYDYFGPDGPLAAGTSIILGASKKDGDWDKVVRRAADKI